MPVLHDAPGRHGWITILEENGTRYLHLDGSEEGAMALASESPVFNYLWFHKCAGSSAARPGRFLVLGAGAFTAPKCLAIDFPDAAIDAVDIELDVHPLALRFFRLDRPAFARIRFHGSSAEDFLRAERSAYDFIFDDLFDGFQYVPFAERLGPHLARLAALLAPGGTLVKNLIWDPRSANTRETCDAGAKALADALPNSGVIALGHPSRGHNRLLIGRAETGAFDWPAFREGLARAGVPEDILTRAVRLDP